MDQQQLFGLMAVAEEQQKAVKAATEALMAERAALAKERAALAQAAASVAGVADEVRRVTGNAVPALCKATGEAVAVSVRDSLAGAEKTAQNALQDASGPFVKELSGFAARAGEAERRLREAVAGFGWKWAVIAGSATAGGIAAVVVSALLMVSWQTYQVRSLSAEREALTADVAVLKDNVAALEKRGGRIRMNTCGGRLCIEVSRNQSKDAKKWDKAVWRDAKTDVPLVIPRGY